MNAYIHAYIQTYICTYMNLGPKHVSRNPQNSMFESRTSKSLGLTVCLAPHNVTSEGLLGGSWGLVSRVISTLIGALSNYKHSYLNWGYK